MYPYGAVTSCKKLEKTNGGSLRYLKMDYWQGPKWSISCETKVLSNMSEELIRTNTVQMFFSSRINRIGCKQSGYHDIKS